MAASENITDKTFRKLTLLVSPEGFSFAVTDTLSGKITQIKTVDFGQMSKTESPEDHYWKAFVDHFELTRNYDEVSIIHDNNLNTFVPKALFDEDYIGSYLQYNTKVFETDFFDFDDLAPHEINNVYVPFVNLNNFLIDHYGPFTYKNVNSILVQKILEKSRNNDERQIFAHIGAKHFELIVVQNQKLILFNSFQYTTREDFLYYLLFTAEQLNLNPENVQLKMLGDVSQDSELYRAAYDYVRNVSLMDVSAEGLTEAQARKYFVMT